MTKRSTLVLIMIAALVLSGCQIDTAPQDVAHFSSNRAAVKDAADYNGKFVLYRNDQDNVAEPILLATHLNKGEIYGFEFDDHQVPFALAGRQRIELTAGKYRWEMTPDAGQIDWQQTDVLVVDILVATAIVAVAVVTVVVTKKQLGY